MYIDIYDIIYYIRNNNKKKKKIYIYIYTQYDIIYYIQHTIGQERGTYDLSRDAS